MPITGGFSSQKKLSTTIPFLISDWVLIGGVYRLDLQHNLESENITATIWDLTEIVDVDRITVYNTNTIRLFTSLDPDCRFEGKAILTKSQ